MPAVTITTPGAKSSWGQKNPPAQNRGISISALANAVSVEFARLGADHPAGRRPADHHRRPGGSDPAAADRAFAGRAAGRPAADHLAVGRPGRLGSGSGCSLGDSPVSRDDPAMRITHTSPTRSHGRQVPTHLRLCAGSHAGTKVSNFNDSLAPARSPARK